MTQSTALMVPQIGVESTPGTAVAATKQLVGMTVQPNIDASITTFTPNGTKVPTVVYNQRGDRMTANVSGPINYNEIVYALSSMITGVTPTQPDTENAAAAYLWTFSPDVDGADSPKTYTVEIKGPDRSYKFAHGLFNSLQLTSTRTGGNGSTQMSGSMLGMAMEDGVTATSSLSGLDIIPITPMEFCIYIDDTAATLGTTKFDENFVWTFNQPAKYLPYESQDCATTTFTKVYEQPTTPTLMLQMERNADASALISDMRNGTKKFIRVEATGATIAGDEKYKLTIDFCGAITQPAFADMEQLATVQYTFTNLLDSTWGKSYEIAVENTVSAL